jgi:hypothetical protein
MAAKKEVAKPANMCTVDGCDNPLMAGSSSLECKLCRGSRWYWDQRTPAQILERRRKLTMYKARLIRFFTDNGRSKD